MSEELQVLVEMTEKVREGLLADLADVGAEEAVWRPLPQANSIALIVRHLAIEGEWHRACLERGEAMPHETTPALQRAIDGVPLDFVENRDALRAALVAFLDTLRTIDLDALRRRSEAAYREWPRRSPHLLGYHQVMHLCMHWGQIRTIRNLYVKTRGEPVPARFFPDNPSYPRTGEGPSS